MHAFAGERERAVRSFEATADTREIGSAEQIYLDATLAFLRDDYEALVDTRHALTSLPEPEWFAEAVDRFRLRYPDKQEPVWPTNLNIVERLIDCFGHPYSVAYGGSCDAVTEP